MLRFVFSVIYAILFTSLSGLTELAYAVSCSDVIDKNSMTTTTYGAALNKFVYFNGKTYAIAKSSTTGSTGLPDAFFAFIPGITREYTWDGVDLASLKKQMAAGTYGVARPVKIDSAATKDFILKQYGAKLGAAGGANGTLINAWKEYKATEFTSMDGGALAYTNWLDSLPPATTDPSAVAMGKDGLWEAASSGQKLSQIVEFDVKLDCAVDLTPLDPSTIVTPPRPDPTTNPESVPGQTTNSNDPNAIKNVICGQNLAEDGAITDIGNILNCLNAKKADGTLGQFCPLGDLDCDAKYKPAICPGDSVLEPERDMCQKDPVVVCPSGYLWDKSIDRCLITPPCSDGGAYNTTTDQCEKKVQNDCPPGYFFDDVLKICQKPVDCGEGASFNVARDRCERAVVFDCPVGFTYSVTSTKCEATPYCPSGSTYSTLSDRCEAPIVNDCPAGYGYDSALDKCVSPAGCVAPSALNPATDRCEMAIGITCPGGYAYDSAAAKCWQTPTCTNSGAYSSASDVCTLAITGGTCPSGYAYDSVGNNCVEAPICVGSRYNTTRNRCEVAVTLTCTSGYTLNGTGCEAAPVCGTGLAYSASTDRCEKTLEACPSGYLWDTGLNACVSTAGCVAPSVLNPTTDRCEMPIGIGCAVGYTYDVAADKCWQTPVCISGGTYSDTNDVCTLASNGGSCPSGYTYDSVAKNCTEAPICTGSAYNTTRNRCEVAVTITCASGYTLNGTVCEAAPTCGTGLNYSDATNRCEKAKAICPTNYTWDTALDKCIATAGCVAPRFLNTTTNLCEMTATPICLSGTAFNATTSKCESSPICAAGGSYSTVDNLCTATNTGTSCPTGYNYSSALGKCTANPICVGGTYSTANNRCEATPNYTCSDATYTYNTTTARCEKIPPCPAGMTYSTTLNVCVVAKTTSCPTNYTYNATRGRCEFSPPTCIAGTAYNSVTNRCETAKSVITGYAEKVIGKTQIVKYKQRGGTGSGITDYLATNPGSIDALAFTFGLQNGQVELLSECAWGGKGNAGCARPHWNGWAREGTVLGQSRSGNTLTVTATIFDNYDTPCCKTPGDFMVGGVSDWDGNVLPYYCQSTTLQQWSTCGDDYNWGYYSCLIPLQTSVNTCLIPEYTTGATASADLSEFASCPAGYSAGAAPSVASCQAIYSHWGAATGFTDCSQAGSYTCSAAVMACPAGTIGANGVCVANPTCAGSTFDGTNDVCYVDLTSACSQGVPDPVSGLCISTPVCSNGLLDVTADKCYQAAPTLCASGYSVSGSVCIATPTCTAPGTFDSSVDACVTSATFQCVAGYTYNAGLAKCSVASNCLAGTVLSTTADKCQVEETMSCTTDCTQTPTCVAGGTYNSSVKKCDSATDVCPSATLDAAADICYVAAVCSNGGSLNGTADKCQVAFGNSCTGGLTFDSINNVCRIASTCDTGGTLDTTTDKCTSAATPTCIAGYGYNSTLNLCTRTADCPSSGAINNAKNRCELDNSYNCDSGFNQDIAAQKCYQAPTCVVGGTYSNAMDKCNGGTAVCTGSTLDVTADKCYAAATCNSGGTINNTTDKCQLTTGNACSGSLLYDSANNVCQVAAACDTGGALNTTTDKCIGTATPACAAGYGYNNTLLLCTRTADCASSGS